jgi:antitoxin HigA-1
MSYGMRLQQALDVAGKDRKALAEALGMSVQAVGQVITGGRSGAQMFNAENSAKAARFLGVDHHWLATGEGQMRTAAVWPFGAELPPEQFFALDKPTVQAALDVMVSAAKRFALMNKLGAPGPAPDARVGKFIEPAPMHELHSDFAELEGSSPKPYQSKGIKPHHPAAKKPGKGRKEG